MNKITRVIIATGGTGGHVFPAYSLAKHFEEKNINVQITSDKRGLKYLEDYKDIKTYQINSSTIFGKNIFKSLFSTIIIFYSLMKSLIFLVTNKPNLVFGMGGYSSFSVCIAARLLKIPLVIYENNLHIGRTNKYLLPFAKKIFVSYKELDGVPIKYKDKIFQIGNIIRKEIIDFKNPPINVSEDKKIKILVLGGSQAAKVFAEKLPTIFKECHKIKMTIKVYQQCLPSQNSHLSSVYKDLNIDFKIFNFTHNILDYFSIADLAITRSGSSMLAELLNAKVPFVAVPLPTSADNHQLKNAMYYEKNHYSYLIEERLLNERLPELLKKINENRSVLDSIKKKQSQYSDKSVYENVDREIEQIINEKY